MKTRVLVADDDAPVRESLKRVLEETDYEVVLAADGQQTIDRFTSERIDLVILDINLPIKSGWDAFEQVTGQNPLVPVIIITGLPNRHPVALAAGAGALMEKPIEVPALLKTMEELLAEPKENRLRRLCGQLPDTRYVPPSCKLFLEKV
jgi:two-component system, cell cycle sensor histidine kinase and response regulator CckA